MGTLDGKVAFITGAGRGQGRSHALRLAREGADIIALDICRDIESVGYEMATEAELDETIAEVEALDRRAVKGVADVRSLSEVQAVVDAGLDQLGRIDFVCANAGVSTFAKGWELTELEWKEMIEINLTGVWNATRAAIPSMIDRKGGGSIVLTSSTAGINGYRHTAHYTAAKHGVIGLTKVLAQELAEYYIRVNAVCPTTVGTKLALNEPTYKLFAPDDPHPTSEVVKPVFSALNLFPDLPWIEPEDVSEAVYWLVSDSSRWVTGISLPVDAGNTIKTW